MNNLTSRRALFATRNLMSYPQDSDADRLRTEGIAALLERLDGPLILRLPTFDLKIEISADTSPHSAYLLSVDDYEMADLVLMQRHIRHEDTVMVAGGGLGVTAALAAKLTSPNPIIIVEANAALHPQIARQVEINAGQASLSGKALVGDMHDHPTGTMGFSLDTNIWYSRISEAPEAVQVEVTDLNELCKAHAPNVILMDIEGAERDILTRTLPACIQKLIVEIHTPDFDGAETARIVSGLAEQGLRMVDQLALVWVFIRE